MSDIRLDPARAMAFLRYVRIPFQTLVYGVFKTAHAEAVLPPYLHSPTGIPLDWSNSTCGRMFTLGSRMITALSRGALCVIGLALAANARNLLQSEHPTFDQDIAPLIYRYCSDCHRPGES